MAKNKEAPLDEKIFTVPLRRKFTSSSRIALTNRTVITVKEFMKKNLHVKNVSISPKVNDSLWRSGAKIPLNKIKVKATVSDGTAHVRLLEETTIEEEKKKFLKEKETKGAPTEAKTEEKSDEKKQEKVENKPEGKPENETKTEEKE